jgi:hypothetical protein
MERWEKLLNIRLKTYTGLTSGAIALGLRGHSQMKKLCRKE